MKSTLISKKFLPTNKVFACTVTYVSTLYPSLPPSLHPSLSLSLSPSLSTPLPLPLSPPHTLLLSHLGGHELCRKSACAPGGCAYLLTGVWVKEHPLIKVSIGQHVDLVVSIQSFPGEGKHVVWHGNHGNHACGVSW